MVTIPSSPASPPGATTSPSPAAPSGPRRSVALPTILCACLAQIMIVLDTTIIAVALPATQAELGFDDSMRQWSITAYTLAFGSLLLVGGRFSQRLGIRVAFLIGITGFAAASLVAGLASDYGALLGGRVVQGAFAALLAPTNLSLMNTAFPHRGGRAKAFGIFGAVAGAGAATGLILGGVLTDELSWRWCFFVNVPLAVLTVALAWRLLRVAPGPVRTGGAGDLPGLALGTIGVFGIVFGLSRADDDGWLAVTTLGLLTGGVLFVVAFVVRQATAADPVLPLRIVRHPVRATSYAAIALVGTAQMGSSLYLTYYFQQNLGYRPTSTGLHFLPMVGGLVVAAVLSTRLLVPRVGLRVVYPLGSAVLALGFVLLSQLGADSPWGSGMTVPLVVGGVGIGLVMAPAMSSATFGVTVEHSGLASATANTSQQIGASIGVAFLGTWAERAVQDSVEAGAAALHEAAARALTAAHALPDSAQGRAILAQLRRTALDGFAVDAYSSGFRLMALLSGVLAVLLAATFAVTRSGGPTAGED